MHASTTDAGAHCRRFVAGVSYGRTVYHYLVKLSSLVDAVRDDICQGSEGCTFNTLRVIFSDIRVRRALAPLACVKDAVLARVEADTRFRVLRPYATLIAETLKSLPCDRARSPSLEDRPALFQIGSSMSTGALMIGASTRVGRDFGCVARLLEKVCERYGCD